MPKRAANREELRELFLEKISQSALTKEHAKKLGFSIMTGEEAKELGIQLSIGGFKIPYFDVAGDQTEFWRFRYLEDTQSGFDKLVHIKPVRYVQAKGSLNQLYMPPLIDWKEIADDTSSSIIITEGELKAACGCAAGIPTIGLGGVWCFKSSAAHMAVLPQFEDFKWDGRIVRICYDSDAGNNTNVMAAENALAKEMTNLGARVHIVRLPALSPPLKTGMDDFIMCEGIDEFARVLVGGVEWRRCKELFQLNEEVVYVRDPGLIVQLSTSQKMAPRSFIEHAYSTHRFNEEVNTGNNRVKLVEKSAPQEWLKWPGRAEVERITYRPGGHLLSNGYELNTWPGWGCLPAEGDITPWNDLLEYVFRNAPEYRPWFEQWLAYPLQHPGTKLYTAAVIWGVIHGTGKSLIGYTLMEIYGKNATEIGDQQLQASFNDWAENKQFVMADEITGGDKRHMADRMKSMITQRFLRVNQKFIPSYTVPDCINYYFTSNHPDAFFLEDTDRRFFIHELAQIPLPQEFYQRYMAWMKGSGINALFHHLLNLDTSDFSPEARAPTTRSKMDMIENGRSDIGAWVSMVKNYPDTVLRLGDSIIDHKFMSAQELHDIYDKNRLGKTTVTGMARELARQGFRKINNGLPVPTLMGPQKLWLVREFEGAEELSLKQISEIYRSDRGTSCMRKLTTKS